MTAVMNAGDVAKVVLRLHQDDDLTGLGTNHQLAFHFRARGAGKTYQDLWTAVDAHVDTVLTPLSAHIVLDNYVISDVCPNTHPGENFNVSAATGTGAQDPTGHMEELEACAVVTWKTPYKGQGNRGRSFFSGIADADAQDNKLTSASEARFNVMANAWIGTWNPVLAGAGNPDFELVLWRSHLSGMPLGTPLVEPIVNPLGVPPHLLHKPNYVYPPHYSVRSGPIFPGAAIAITDFDVHPNIRGQRRRLPGENITRFHRV